jgi:hypothetical protein
MNLQSPGVRYGIIAGTITLVAYLVAYFIDKRLFIEAAGISLGTFLIYLWAMRQASVQGRNYFFEQTAETPTHYTFSQAVQPPFLVYLIAQTIFVFFQFVMLRLVDPSLIELTKQLAIEQVENLDKFPMSIFKSLNLISDELLEAMEEAKEKLEVTDFTPSISTTLFGLASSLIMGFLISAIYGLVFRRHVIPAPSDSGQENEEPTQDL